MAELLEIHDLAGQGLTFLYNVGFTVWNPPADMTFASGAYARGMPNVAVFHRTERVSGFEQRADRNPLLFRLDPDWVFITGTLGTLVALLLTYDGIAGEKERGSLRQILSNSVPRDRVLVAKYLAAFLVTTASILVGVAVALAIVQVAGDGVALAAVPVLAGVVVCALLRVSTFLWLGLWASCRTEHSALALLGGLMAWVLLAVFLPHSGGLIGDRLVPVERRSDMERSIWQAEPQVGEEPGEAAARAQRHYWDQLVRQVVAARSVIQLSPVAALRVCAEALTGTGIVRYRAFVEQVHEYRQTLRDFIVGKDAEDPDSSHEMTPGHIPETSQRPVVPEEVPLYQYREPPIGERFGQAVPAVVVLVVANGVCFLGALTSFRRYDVR